MKRTYAHFKKRMLKDPVIRETYRDLDPEFAIAATLIKRRLERRLTQKDLAERIGTKQSAIARLESGAYNPSLSFLHKVADALDARLEISVSAR